MNTSLLKRSFLQAAGVVAYVTAVSAVMSFLEGRVNAEPGWFGPAVFLSLFVVSAAVTSSLVFGSSILLYLDGSKQRAVRLAAATVAWLAAFVVVSIAVIVLR